jgi:chemotaxis protein CheD
MKLDRLARPGDPLESEPLNKVYVIQGEYRVTDDPTLVLTSILGSCVAACMRDPVARVGGMNHFLLPGCGSGSRRQEAERYGVHLMELLVNGLMRRGARRERLQAKLFGGARTMEGLSDIGALNADFAERFLRNEGIAIVGGSLRGELGRRIQFWPVSGRARQVMLRKSEIPSAATPKVLPPAACGAVEFF